MNNKELASSEHVDYMTNSQLDALHPDTSELVDKFAFALKEKLYAAQVKYGYSNGWQNHDWMDECREKLLEHLEKGDPRDVANYCAFLWHHGQPTAAPAQPQQSDRIAELEAEVKILTNNIIGNEAHIKLMLLGYQQLEKDNEIIQADKARLLEALKDFEKWIEELPIPTKGASFFYKKLGSLIAEMEGEA